jgi:hypothetical protein
LEHIAIVLSGSGAAAASSLLTLIRQEAQMERESDRPRPHGDPLQSVVEENQAQRQSDAKPDVLDSPDELRGTSDRSEGRGSTANGIPAFDEEAGDARRKLYEEGAELVSRID